MAIFEQVLRNLLIDAALVERRVFLWRAPQVPAERAKTPYAVFFHVTPNPRHHQQGPLGLQDRDYQLSLFDTSQTRVLDIADRFRAYLDGYKAVYGGVKFERIGYVTQVPRYEDDTKLFHVLQEYNIMYLLPEGFAASAAPRGDLPRNQPVTNHQTNQE